MTISGKIAGKWPAGFCRVAGGKPAVAWQRVAQRQGISLALRLLPSHCPQLEQLGAPPVLPELLKSENGMILVTGATGSGKSTTLAAMVGYLNQHADAHILTLEDPVEYLTPASDV